MDGDLKKWFMLQVWRIQQIAQIMTIALLAINLSLQMYSYMQWRSGSFFATPYTGATLILLILAAVIWAFAIVWDLRLKMWREQATVLIERNPYTKEKLTSKEIVLYGVMWLPILEKLGKEDPKLASAAAVIRDWIKSASVSDPNVVREVKELFDHIGKDGMDLLGLEKK